MRSQSGMVLVIQYIMENKIIAAIAAHNAKCEARWNDEYHIELLEFTQEKENYKVVLAIGKHDRTVYVTHLSNRGVIVDEIILGEPTAELRLGVIETLIEDVILDEIYPRRRIGSRLRALREEQGLTTRELADKAGIDYSHIAKIERGTYNLRVDTLHKVATALKAEITITSQFKTNIMTTDIKNTLEKYGNCTISPLCGIEVGEAILHIFDCDGDTAAAITYNDNDIVFTNTDWQGWCPRAEEDIPECDWIAIDEHGNTHHAVILNGLPRILG